MRKIICQIIVLTFLLSGCALQTNTEKGATYGAAGGAVAGALLGQAIGRDTEATLWGTAIGAALGGATGAGVGRMMDNQEREMRQALATSEAAAVRREGNLLAIVLKGDLTFDTLHHSQAWLAQGVGPDRQRHGGISPDSDQGGGAHRQHRQRRL